MLLCHSRTQLLERRAGGTRQWGCSGRTVHLTPRDAVTLSLLALGAGRICWGHRAEQGMQCAWESSRVE